MTEAAVPEIAPSKPWYLSKTLWVNAAIAATAWILQQAGVNMGIGAETQLSIMAVVNMLLRKVTKTEITR